MVDDPRRRDDRAAVAAMGTADVLAALNLTNLPDLEQLLREELLRRRREHREDTPDPSPKTAEVPSFESQGA
jgi:hypothetical protein